MNIKIKSGRRCGYNAHATLLLYSLYIYLKLAHEPSTLKMFVHVYIYFMKNEKCNFFSPQPHATPSSSFAFEHTHTDGHDKYHHRTDHCCGQQHHRTRFFFC